MYGTTIFYRHNRTRETVLVVNLGRDRGKTDRVLQKGESRVYTSVKEGPSEKVIWIRSKQLRGYINVT